MGNAVSLSIVLDGSEGAHPFRAGTRLSGRILIQGKHKIPGSTIELLIKGKEKTVIHGDKTTRRAARDIFHVLIKMNDFSRQDKVPRGSYSFPFSIELPESLPSSFSYGYGGHFCSVQYKCVASVGCEANATVHQAFSVVAKPMQDVKVPCFLEPKTQEITSMGVLSKGCVMFGVAVDDTHIAKGQELVLSIACKNDTTVDIEHVYFKLVELITWEVNTERTETRKRELVGLTELHLPGLVTRRKSKEEMQQDKRAGRDTLNQSNFQQLYQELSSGRNSIQIHIPEGSSDSYEGTLVRVSHYIKLYLKTPKMVGDIEEKIPLRIGSPAQRVQQATRVDVRPQQPPAAIPAVAPAATTGIRFASAVPLPANTVEAPVATAPAEAIVLGGTATMYDSNVAGTADLADLIPMPPPQAPSLRALLDEMTVSVNDFDIISSKLDSADWRPIFAGLTPQEFGSIIAHVNMDFDQPRVAATLAPHVNGGNCFTCVYCLSAVQNAAQWNRTAMIQKLLPLCVDARTGFTMLQDELSPWEQTVTAREFQIALDHSDR